jgi:hypothetical protein
MTNRINPQELPGLEPCPFCGMNMQLDAYGFMHPDNDDCIIGFASFALDYIPNWNTRADTLESLAAENERLTEENADLRNRLSRIVAC